MAQTGFTPLLIYSSSTATNAPTAGNLLNNATGSELAINIADGKLFYKDSANAVQVIGWKTTPTTAGGTGLTSYTAGDMVYWASGTAFTKLGIGASGTVLTSSGTAPQWSTSLSVSGSLTAAAGLVSTNTFTGTPPADGIVVDYATGFGRFSAFTGDGFQWYNAGVANTKLMQLSSTGQLFNYSTSVVGGSLFKGTANTSSLYGVYDSPTTANSNYLLFGIDTTGGSVGFASGGVFVSTGANGTGTSRDLINHVYGANNIIFATNNSDRGRWDSSGNFLQGLTSLTATFGGIQANGVISATGFGCRTGTGGSYGGNRFNLNWTGAVMNLYVDNTNLGSITTVSDYRVKYNVENINNSALDRVNQLRPVSYTFKDVGIFKNDSVVREGFIAHELQKIIPSSVNGEKDAVDSDGNIQPQSLDLAPVVAVLTKALQELNTKFDAYVASHP